MGAPAIRAPITPQPATASRSGGGARASSTSPVDGMRVRVGHRRAGVGAGARHRRRPARSCRVHREVRRDAGRARGAGLRRRDPRLARPGRLATASWPTAGAAMWSRSSDYLADLAARRWPTSSGVRLPQPLLMLAHSMGGHVGLRYLHDRPGTLRRRRDDRTDVRHRACGRLPEPLARAICAVAIRLGAAPALRARPARLRDPDRSPSPATG